LVPLQVLFNYYKENTQFPEVLAKILFKIGFGHNQPIAKIFEAAARPDPWAILMEKLKASEMDYEMNVDLLFGEGHDDVKFLAKALTRVKTEYKKHEDILRSIFPMKLVVSSIVTTC